MNVIINYIALILFILIIVIITIKKKDIYEFEIGVSFFRGIVIKIKKRTSKAKPKR